MRRTLIILSASILSFALMANSTSGEGSDENSREDYFPERDNWQSQSAASLGLKQVALEKTINFAKSN